MNLRALRGYCLVRLLSAAEKCFPASVTSPYALVTLHRPSNVDDLPWLGELITTLSELSAQLSILFPVHPRTRQRLREVEAFTAHVETGASPVKRSEASAKGTRLEPLCAPAFPNPSPARSPPIP